MSSGFVWLMRVLVIINLVLLHYDYRKKKIKVNKYVILDERYYRLVWIFQFIAYLLIIVATFIISNLNLLCVTTSIIGVSMFYVPNQLAVKLKYVQKK